MYIYYYAPQCLYIYYILFQISFAGLLGSSAFENGIYPSGAMFCCLCLWLYNTLHTFILFYHIFILFYFIALHLFYFIIHTVAGALVALLRFHSQSMINIERLTKFSNMFYPINVAFSLKICLALCYTIESIFITFELCMLHWCGY